MQSLKEFATKQEAIDYIAIKTAFISPNSMNSVLARFGIFRACQIISETDGHPAQDAMLAMLDAKSNNFNFIQGDDTGDAQIQLLDQLIAGQITQVVGANTVDVSAQLAQAKPVLLFMCNTPYQPYKDITEHEWKLAKGTIIRAPIQAVDGVATLVVNTEVEKHNPQIYQYLQGADYYKRVAGFRDVGKVGTYKVECPQFANLYVDNAYGVV